MEVVSADPQAARLPIASLALRDATSRADAEAAVATLLRWVGCTTHPGVDGTPARVARALWELTAGYADDPAQILSVRFDQSYDEVVLLDGIEFTSLCEHHLLPFRGTAAVAYIPAERGGVVGLSKLARLVECYARRLQLQERMTEQIAQALEEHLHPRGVGVIIRAHHQCMGCRGVRQPSARMTTSVLRGVFFETPAARTELLSLIAL